MYQVQVLQESGDWTAVTEPMASYTDARRGREVLEAGGLTARVVCVDGLGGGK